MLAEQKITSRPHITESVSPSPHRKQHSLRYDFQNMTRAYKTWLRPYVKSQLHKDEFHPTLSFFYTDLNCNLNCPYCFSKGKRIPGMTEKTAKDAIDWLHATGCRVLAYMGGEPLVRKDLIIELTRYAVDKDFYVYLPTNGILFDKKFTDDIGKAGVASINIAVDAVTQKKDLPKYFERIKSQFEYIVQQERKYGYIPFFNINITENNLRDVKELTEIAHSYGIATDYHICEMPPMDYDTLNDTEQFGCITNDKYQQTDELIDWLVDKNKNGYAMANSIEHLKAMKLFVRGELPHWRCKAGEASMVIRLDGSFVPCMEYLGSDEDWGNIYDGAKFDSERLNELKKNCSPNCLSTCNFQVSHYTESGRYLWQWVAKHTFKNIFGTS